MCSLETQIKTYKMIQSIPNGFLQGCSMTLKVGCTEEAEMGWIK
ncbi:hypothetical protein [Ruminiclostridium cellulolyticum]|nr:hypothetical protein [Ruminiclostridium cellulolyticum]